MPAFWMKKKPAAPLPTDWLAKALKADAEKRAAHAAPLPPMNPKSHVEPIGSGSTIRDSMNATKGKNYSRVPFWFKLTQG